LEEMYDSSEPKPVSRKRYATDLETLQKEVEVDTYRSSGPGGQRKNKTETAVRLKHIPSGITVVASERRSQALNREIAFHRLQARLEALNRPRKRRTPTRPSAAAMRRQEEEKRHQSQKKSLRRQTSPSEEELVS